MSAFDHLPRIGFSSHFADGGLHDVSPLQSFLRGLRGTRFSVLLIDGPSGVLDAQQAETIGQRLIDMVELGLPAAGAGR
ncbi:Hypothetical protein HEAR1497 [Herminiimonas arsenicoxydans]|uniref:Uncharacterized protein n=1 Tax=Herminiimonas arsenicoxydans TaxID=204773 RepID=A4G579_HERAR|nr:Hypothetical protein HEAR1497 [Herminiimonas arsenicoxydans]